MRSGPLPGRVRRSAGQRDALLLAGSLPGEKHALWKVTAESPADDLAAPCGRRSSCKRSRSTCPRKRFSRSHGHLDYSTRFARPFASTVTAVGRRRRTWHGSAVSSAFTACATLVSSERRRSPRSSPTWRSNGTSARRHRTRRERDPVPISRGLEGRARVARRLGACPAPITVAGRSHALRGCWRPRSSEWDALAHGVPAVWCGAPRPRVRATQGQGRRSRSSGDRHTRRKGNEGSSRCSRNRSRCPLGSTSSACVASTSGIWPEASGVSNCRRRSSGSIRARLGNWDGKGFPLRRGSTGIR
jgi:hypothetical protein